MLCWGRLTGYTSPCLAFAVALSGCGDTTKPANSGDDEAAVSSEASVDDESGAQCTEIACTSSLVVAADHDFDLATGGYVLELDTPLHEIRCSIDAQASGSDSCFGFRFVDVQWTTSAMTITLTEPFFDTDLNPEALPFDEVTLRLILDGETIVDEALTVDGKEPVTPNGEDCPPVCWAATATVDLRG